MLSELSLSLFLSVYLSPFPSPSLSLSVSLFLSLSPTPSPSPSLSLRPQELLSRLKASAVSLEPKVKQLEMDMGTIDEDLVTLDNKVARLLCPSCVTVSETEEKG